MSARGFRHRGPASGRGGKSRPSFGAASFSREESPSGDLVDKLSASAISPSNAPAQISDFQCIASYNWLDQSEPAILVPGSPATWSPPAHCRKLQPDTGKVFIDQNAARYSSFPWEPTFRAVYEMHPEIELDDFDVVMCRNTMGKLFDFVTTNQKDFEIDVEIVGEKAVFIRKEQKTTEIIDGFRGFGHTFPEEYTRWDSETKGSSSHHRVAEYMFAGLKYLLRFESDCYLADKTSRAKSTLSAQHGYESNLIDTTMLLSTGGALKVSESLPTTDRGLVLRKGGRQVDQAAMVEIKTRAAHKLLDMNSVLPRLWISQTPNLISAYHKGGRFNDVKILDVSKDVTSWEKENSRNLQKLDAVIRWVIETVRRTISMKCRVRGNNEGTLEVWELESSYQSVLPDDLLIKLRE